MRFLTLLAGLAGVATSTAAVNGPELGKPAPPLSLSRILFAPSDANVTWQALHGKVVVIEFWATWCGPCRESIPHWNELVETFKDKPVQFLAITEESEQVVAAFLKQTPIHSWVGFDGPGKSMRDLYGIQGIPTTVIVDTNGIVAAVAHTEAPGSD
jgi:thiol-disulfide isomerase/thioredoxin